jgi:ABC-type polysaccharide/polyol phosphate transport system ATPase subunit
MSCNQTVVSFQNIWKKFFKRNVAHRSLREDIVGLLTGGIRKTVLGENEFWALQEVNFNIKRGEIINLAGLNGAGKTTILRLISNLTDPTRGKITVDGRVAPIIELGTGFHPDLSGHENIFVNGVILGMKIKEIKERIKLIIKFSEIEEFIHTPVRYYSSGMYVRLAFAVAIHSHADIYLFDEVIAVGDEPFQEKCINKIIDLRKDNKTIIYVSHDSRIAEKLSARIIRIDKGRMAQEVQN